MTGSDEFARALHVIQGCTAAESLKAALHLERDQILVNEDPISCGPAPAVDDLSQWRQIREQFLRDMIAEPLEFSFDAHADNGLLMNVERLGQETSVFLWAACGLPDQLLLAWVISLFDRQGLDLSRLRTIQFERLEPHQRVLGMGELTPEQIRQFRPDPRALETWEIKELRRAWKVYTSSDPANLLRYVDGSSQMPPLHQAIRRLVYRYPDRLSGVGRTDERLLYHAVEEGPDAVRVIGHTMAEFFETLDLFGDSYLFRRLIALGRANLSTPLISIAGDTENMRNCEIRLTSFGNKVLAGKANNVQENGIDDWVGGVHLSSERPVTFRDGSSLVLLS